MTRLRLGGQHLTPRPTVDHSVFNHFSVNTDNSRGFQLAVPISWFHVIDHWLVRIENCNSDSYLFFILTIAEKGDPSVFFDEPSSFVRRKASTMLKWPKCPHFSHQNTTHKDGSCCWPFRLYLFYCRHWRFTRFSAGFLNGSNFDAELEPWISLFML